RTRAIRCSTPSWTEGSSSARGTASTREWMPAAEDIAARTVCARSAASPYDDSVPSELRPPRRRRRAPHSASHPSRPWPIPAEFPPIPGNVLRSSRERCLAHGLKQPVSDQPLDRRQCNARAVVSSPEKERREDPCPREKT